MTRPITLAVLIVVVAVAAIGVSLTVGCKQAGAAGTVVAPADAAGATGAVYICTMCPDVHSNKPGKCPKCGMALVKKGN